jgi:mediator of RNA polymerase II transcription subunit 17
MPVQASTTLRPELRDRVGIGTLGAHKVHETNITPEKKKDDAEVAIGLKLMEIDKTRDAAAKAAAFLEAETQKEALFWDDILAIKQNGWAVCRLPQESYTLGVKFGFTEGQPFPAIRSLTKSADPS